MRAADFDAQRLLADVERDVADWRFGPGEHGRILLRCREVLGVLAECAGTTLQERWDDFESRIWPGWDRGQGRIGGELWRWGTWALVLTARVRPSWGFMATGRVGQWLDRLPADHPLVEAASLLGEAAADLAWLSEEGRERGVLLGVRVLLVEGHRRVEEISDDDLGRIPSTTKGLEALDATLCRLGVLNRTPRKGSTRRKRSGRLSPAELVERSDIPERFRTVTALYLDAYAARISDTYSTLRAKCRALAHFWRYLDERHPEVACSSQVRPVHARGFVSYAMEHARLVRRGGPGPDEGDRTTAHAWVVYIRTFFADVCTWASEPGSPLAVYAPPMVPITRHDLVGVGFEKARRRSAARMAATVVDLEREMPNIRAFAFRRWQEAEQALTANPGDAKALAVEADTFWDWALLELLVQSGLRIEEASELTTLDVLKRRLGDGRLYYLLHVKPSKFDRARVIPIGDSLGRVLAEIVRHVKRFYASPVVPACDHWDHHEKRPLPRAPYLLQGAKHPSAIGVSTIRQRLARLSALAGARRADGTPLVLRPHDCRRVFASEHLNNHTPIHVIQALLGHATVNTVMVYAKLYPAELVEGYRRTLRSLYSGVHGPDALRNPTAEEWAAFNVSCSMRDMGTHLCALPTGEHCPKGLVCLGCVHAQPKRSAVPVFRHMLASHRRALARARENGEPAGQIAARELEVARIEHALRRAEELADDVAAAIDATANHGPALIPVVVRR